MGSIEITTKLSRLKSVSSIGNDYLEAASGGVLKNFVIFTGKHLCWSLFLIKLQACKFIEGLQIFKNTYFEKHQRATASDYYVSSQQFICFRMSLYNDKEKLVFQ